MNEENRKAGKRVGLAFLDATLIAYLLAEGFQWSDERECYFMPHEEFLHWNNKPIELGKHSFTVDAFHHAVHPAYGGDCGKRTSEILSGK